MPTLLATSSPRATAVWFTDELLCLRLGNWQYLAVPLAWFPKLRTATPAQLAGCRFIGEGIGLRWDELDEDLAVGSLLAADANQIRDFLRQQVARFRSWAAEQPQDHGEWECDYGDWTPLYTAVQATLASRHPLTEEEIALILYALARDNEMETVKDILHHYPVKGRPILRAAVAYDDPQARWQAADALGQYADDEARHLLRRFVTDEDEYVRRRALLALAKNDASFAGAVAVTWVAAKEEYTRIAALTVLAEVQAPDLPVALDQLRADPSEHVRKLVVEIESGRREGPRA